MCICGGCALFVCGGICFAVVDTKHKITEHTYVYDTLFAYRHLVYVLILTGSIVIRSAFCARCLRKEFVNY